MGLNAGAIHVCTSDREAVVAACERVAAQAPEKLVISGVKDDRVIIFPEGCGQSEATVEGLARELTSPMLWIGVHDSDVVFYRLYDEGALVDEYNSTPEYFGEVSREEIERTVGRAEVFAGWVDAAGREQLGALLDRTREYVFQEERLREMAKVLGLARVDHSYESLMEMGRLPKGFAHVPGLAKRGAEKRRRTEWWKGLKKAGIVLGERGEFWREMASWCRYGDGILVLADRSQIWNSNAAKLKGAELWAMNGTITAAPELDGVLLAAASADGQTVAFREVGRSVLRKGETRIDLGEVLRVSFVSGDGNRVLTSVGAFDVATGREIIPLTGGNEERVIAVNDDASVLICLRQHDIFMASSDSAAFGSKRLVLLGGARSPLTDAAEWLAQGIGAGMTTRQGELVALLQKANGIGEVATGAVERPRCACFVRGGSAVVFGTDRGIRMYMTDRLLKGSRELVPADWAFDLRIEPARGQWATHISAIAYDQPRDEIVFGCHSGILWRCSLETGEMAELLRAPAEAMYLSLDWSADRRKLMVMSRGWGRKLPSREQNAFDLRLFDYERLRASPQLAPDDLRVR